MCWAEPCSYSVIKLTMFDSMINLILFHSVIKLTMFHSTIKIAIFHSVTKLLWYQRYDLFLHLLLYHQPHSSWFHLFNLINWIDSIVVHVPPSSYSSSSATSVVSSPTHVLVQIPRCITHLSITMCTPHSIQSCSGPHHQPSLCLPLPTIIVSVLSLLSIVSS